MRIIINKDNKNKVNVKKNDNLYLIIENTNENEQNYNIIEKYEIKNLNNMSLDDILKFYSSEEGNTSNLVDIYNYKFHYQLSGRKYGKYTESFIKKIKII